MLNVMVALIGNQRVAGRAYNVGGEVTTVSGVVLLIARAMGVDAQIVPVPQDVAARHPPVLHWGEARVGSAFMSTEAAPADIDWRPRLGIEDGYRDAWRWYDAEGRGRYHYDFAAEDAILAELGRS